MSYIQAGVMLTLLATAAMPNVPADPAGEVTTATTPPTVERKTYISKQFGFAFDYPGAWVVLEKPGSKPGEPLLGVRLLTPEENVDVMRDYSPGSVSVDVFANPKRKPLREWLDENGWPFDVAGRSVRTIALGGVPGLEVATGKMFAPNRFTYVATRQWVLRLSFLAPDAETVKQSFHFD